MEIGLDTFSFHQQLAVGRYDVFEAMDWMAGKGLTGCQINLNGPRGRFLGGDPEDRAHCRRVRSHAESHGLALELAGGQVTRVDRISEQLALCREMGAETLRTVLGFEVSVEEVMRGARSALEKLLPIAEKNGVRIALENHEDVFSEEVARLVGELDHPFLGALLDTGNDLVVSRDPEEGARILAPLAISSHFKDQKRIRVGGTTWSVGVGLGRGDVPLERILKILCERSGLKRVLIQNTIGYATPLNRFQRPDVQPAVEEEALPVFPDWDAAGEAGYSPSWDQLPPERQSTQAGRQESELEADLAWVREKLQDSCAKEEPNR